MLAAHSRWLYLWAGLTVVALASGAGAPQVQDTEADTTAAGQESAPPDQGDTPKLEGPMRLELLGVFEQRVRYAGRTPGVAMSPSLRVQLKLTGEKLPYLARIGQPFVEQATDDAGQSLVRLEDPRSDAGERTKAYTVSPGTLRAGHLPLEVNLKPTSRNARTIAQLKGFLSVGYSKQTEEVTILDPLSFTGRTLDHPRLLELGVQIEMVEPEASETGGPGRGLGLRIRSGEDLVKTFEVYDANFRVVGTRASNRKPVDADPYILLSTMGVTLTADHTLVVILYPDLEREKIAFDLKDIELP